ncbi:MAG: CopG family antitoxin [Crocosphaera sp.]
MNNKPNAVDPIPEEFSSYEAAAEFWDNHDTTDYLDDFETVQLKSDSSFLLKLDYNESM